MRLELAERLRCPATHHAPTPLIVVAREVVGRDLRSGIAGCPVCSLEARFVAGALWFGAPPPSTEATRSGDVPAPQDIASSASASSVDVERLVALMGLAEPGGAVLLTRAYAGLAAALEVVAGVSVVIHDPSGTHLPAGLGAVHGVVDAVPFTDGTFRAVAIDAAAAQTLADAVRCVVPQGRVVAAAALVPPDGVTVLARDAREWVGERGALPAPVVTLGRRGR